MRLMKSITLCSITLFFMSAHANTIRGDLNLDQANLGHVTVNGSAELKNSTFKSLTVNGHLQFNQLTVLDNLVVNGSATGEGAICKQLKVEGDISANKFKADNAHIDGNFAANDIQIKHHLLVEGALEGSGIKIADKAIVYGELYAVNSDFKNIELHSDYCLLQDSKVKHLVFKNVKSPNTQKLILTGKTIITGDVVFETNGGEIHMDKESVILGKIKGAPIIAYEHTINKEEPNAK